MLQKIIKDQSLKTVSQMYAITKNLLAGELLCILEQHTKTNVNNTKESYKMVIEGLTTHFFPNKALQPQMYIPPPGPVQALENQYAQVHLLY